jgi:hypothetical protein
VVRNNLTGGFIFMREVSTTRWMDRPRWRHRQHDRRHLARLARCCAHSAAARGGMLNLTGVGGVRMGHRAVSAVNTGGAGRHRPRAASTLYAP